MLRYSSLNIISGARVKTVKVRGINYVNKKRHKQRPLSIASCPRRELNPHPHCCRQDFKSCVSTSSTTRANKECDFEIRVLDRHPKKNPRFIRGSLSGRPGSNRPPQPWQGCALPNELLPRYKMCKNQCYLLGPSQSHPPDKSGCSTILPTAIGTIGTATSALN
jgi:hypothetical protein